VHGEVHLTTYRTDILYRYTRGGETFHSNRYSFTENGSVTTGGRERVLQQYPPGASAVCYVNPSDPSESVLTRRVSPTAAFGAVPLAAFLLGLLAAMKNMDDAKMAAAVRRSAWTLSVLGGGALICMIWAVFAMP
jgi:hypothetical protein